MPENSDNRSCADGRPSSRGLVCQRDLCCGRRYCTPAVTTTSPELVLAGDDDPIFQIGVDHDGSERNGVSARVDDPNRGCRRFRTRHPRQDHGLAVLRFLAVTTAPSVIAGGFGIPTLTRRFPCRSTAGLPRAPDLSDLRRAYFRLASSGTSENRLVNVENRARGPSYDREKTALAC
jgi:hypothetical protein